MRDSLIIGGVIQGNLHIPFLFATYVTDILVRYAHVCRSLKPCAVFFLNVIHILKLKPIAKFSKSPNLLRFAYSSVHWTRPLITHES